MASILQLNKGKSFLDTVLEKLPEAERAGVRTLYSQAQDEVDQHTTALNAKAKELDDWWTKNKDRLGEPNPNQPAGGNPNPNNPINMAVERDAIFKEVDLRLGKVADNLAGQGLALSTMIPTIVAQHGVEFGGEVLDAEKLVNDAIKANMDVKSFYSHSVADRRATASKVKYDAEMKAAEARGHAAGIAEASRGNIPYPSARMSPTTLSGLRTPDAGQPNPHSLDAAVATAVEVMNQQNR